MLTRLIWFFALNTIKISCTIWRSVEEEGIDKLLRVPREEQDEFVRSIENALKCQSNEHPKNSTIALSLKRFVQYIVMTKKKSEISDCFKEKPNFNEVDIMRSDTWATFCVGGYCTKKNCICAEYFTGRHCESLDAKCWLFYCMPLSCSGDVGDLACSCAPETQTDKERIIDFWYDDKPGKTLIPPPQGWHNTESLRGLVYIVAAMVKRDKFGEDIKQQGEMTKTKPTHEETPDDHQGTQQTEKPGKVETTSLMTATKKTENIITEKSSTESTAGSDEGANEETTRTSNEQKEETPEEAPENKSPRCITFIFLWVLLFAKVINYCFQY